MNAEKHAAADHRKTVQAARYLARQKGKLKLTARLVRRLNGKGA